MSRRARAPRSSPSKRAPKTPKTPKAAPPAEARQPQPAIRLGFVRGVAPSKWAGRWASIVPEQPLELVPLDFHETQQGRDVLDVVLERVASGSMPPGTEPEARSRHAVRLYEEAVALVVATGHELAERSHVDLEELELVNLLDHPDHLSSWPASEPWADPAWRPSDALATLELVATGAGGALLPLPLARHLSRKREHTVLLVGSETHSPLPGTEIWVSWAVERDRNDIQRLIGVLRGRGVRSSR